MDQRERQIQSDRQIKIAQLYWQRAIYLKANNVEEFNRITEEIQQLERRKP